MAKDDLYHDVKPYHLAAKFRRSGTRALVSALCFTRPRAINLRVATWTIRPEAVTCPKCLKAIKAAEAAGLALPVLSRAEGGRTNP